MSKRRPAKTSHSKQGPKTTPAADTSGMGRWAQLSVGDLWNHFWFRRFDPLSVGLFRIFLGSLMLIMFAASYPGWVSFYDADGILSLNDPDLDPYRQPVGWSLFALTQDLLPTMFWWWFGTLVTISFIAGLATRLCTISLFLLVCSMVNRTPVMVNGEDLVFRMLLFHGMFAPLGHSLSLDAWLRRRWRRRAGLEDAPPRPMIWAIRMMQINVALIYVISLPFKLADDAAWLQGDAIYWTLASDMWSRGWFPEMGYRWGGAFSKLATYGTILIEGQFPILVCFRRTRLLAIGLVTSLHLGIAVMVPNVALFTLSMVCAFWIFMPPATTRALLRKLHLISSQEPACVAEAE